MNFILNKFLDYINFYNSNKKSQMKLESTTQKSDPIIKLEIQKKLQLSSLGFQNQSDVSEDQMIQNKVDLKLYLHFERMLEKQEYHYNKKSQFLGKKVSKQQITNETIKYLDHLKENIKPLPSQHYQQLLLLIDYFNDNNLLITNRYFISSNNQDSVDQVKFILDFYDINQRMDLEQFLSFKNWHHLGKLSFFSCDWFNDDDWKALVKHADNFKNLEWLNLVANRVSSIKEGDIEKFKSLDWIDFRKLFMRRNQNPLSTKSKEILRRLKQKNNKITIHYNE